jgi:hypothetical protein
MRGAIRGRKKMYDPGQHGASYRGYEREIPDSSKSYGGARAAMGRVSKTGRDDFQKMVRAWQGGDWETTIACMMLQGRVEKIQKLADSI